jgi:hypothetical protein
VLALRAAAESDDEERRAADLEEQVAGDEQPRAPVEGVLDRDDMSRLANISPTSAARTGSGSGSSQFAPQATMYQA